MPRVGKPSIIARIASTSKTTVCTSMNSTRSIQTVTFDLDDTLWSVGPVIINAERMRRDWLDEHCPEMTRRFDREALLKIRARIVQADPGLIHDISALRIASMTQAMELSGYDPEDADRLARNAFEVFMEGRHTIDYFDGVLELLNSLHGEFRLGVISNGNADVRRLSIGDYFDFAVAAGEVGSSKPEPDMFHRAMELAQCAAHSFVHIGDSWENDVLGATQVGMHTIWVNLTESEPRSAHELETEHEQVSELESIPNAIEQIAKRVQPGTD